MKMKQFYTAPEVEQMEVKLEAHFLDGSVASVSGANFGGWTSGEEDW